MFFNRTCPKENVLVIYRRLHHFLLAPRESNLIR